jgi:hypothetical protein
MKIDALFRTSLFSLLVAALSVLGQLTVPQPAAALEFGELSVVGRSGGRSDLFAIAEDHSVLHMWQGEATGPWNGPESLSGAAQDLSAVMLTEDRFEVFAAGSGNEILRSAQDYDSWAWSAWDVLPGEAKRLSVAKADDGTVGLFYVGTDDSIYFATRATPDAIFTDGVNLGFAAKDVAAIAAVGGGFEVFAIGADDTTSVAPIALTATESPAWENLGLQARALSAVRTSSGTAAVAVIGFDDAGWVKQRTETGWSDWVSAGGQIIRIEPVEIDNALTLIALASDANVLRSTATEGGWTPFEVVREASPLQTTFAGTAVVSIPDQDVREDRDIELGIRFDVSRTRVTITSFPAITTDKFDTPFGSTTSTVTLASGGEGSFDPASGSLELPVTLQFDQSLDIPLINEDVRATFRLSTAKPGAALDRDSGAVTLAADSTFDGIGGGVNPLDGLDVSVTITGTLDPRP